MRSGLVGLFGYSLVELLVVIAVISLLAAIAIPVVNDVRSSAGRAAARDNLSLLNNAINAHNMAATQMPAELTAAEVVEKLETPPHGSSMPFLKVNKSFPQTQDTDTYRGVWDGRYFRLVEPGSAGTGVDLQR